MVRACIFDLDGVLVDTAKYHFLAWKRLADELNIPFTEEDNERLKGVSRMDSLDIILSLGGKSLTEQEKVALAERKNTWFVEYINRMKADEIFPGVRDLLQEIKEKRVKVALASSSKNALAVLKLLQIENQFDTVVDGSMVAHAKPDPELFLLAAKRLQTQPQDCVVFEDAEAGVEAALRAGMKCVGVGSPKQLSKANHIISKISDFPVGALEKI